MSANSKIEWTDHTFNPWIGCTRVSPGCDNCYAAVSTPSRVMGVTWGPGEVRHQTSASTWKQPKAWNAKHDAFYAIHGRRQRVFCASLADVFDNEVSNTLRSELLALIYDTPNLDWLLLTKRIGNVPRLMEECTEPGKQWELPPNVWLGATIVNQEEADRDIPKLLAMPAAKRFLSMEPLLGPVNLAAIDIDGWHEVLPLGAQWLDRLDPGRVEEACIDWVIVGGESGPGARPMHPDWARSLRDQCAAASVPFFFKQWGEFAPNWFNDGSGRKIAGSEWIDRMGKRIAGRQLDGRAHDEFPRSA